MGTCDATEDVVAEAVTECPDHAGAGGAEPASLAALCLSCPLRPLPLFRPFQPADLAFAQRGLVARRRFAPESDILRADELGGGPYTIVEGWAYRYRSMTAPDASTPRWQILEFLLPGDMFGMDFALTGRAGSPVRALTAVSLCAHDPREFAAVFEQRPVLARALMESMARDSQRADARLAAIGQGSGAQRAAYLMLEIRDRLARLGMLPGATPDAPRGSTGPIPFPPQRRHLAAALGMSGTHVSRSLAELEAAGLARLAADGLVILDAGRLATLCGYVSPPEEAGRRVLL